MNQAGAIRLIVRSLALCLGAVAAAPAATAPATQPTTAPTAVMQAHIRHIQCAENLRQIGLGLVMYSMDEDNKTGKYPPDLGTLLVRKHAQMPWFVCPAAPSALPDGWQKMTPKQQGDWVNAHSDYVYVGAGKNNSAGSDVPIAYERDDDHADGFINVLFADSFVKTMRLADARRILGPKAGTERNTTRLKPAPGQPPVWPMITENEAKAIVARTDLAGINQALDMFQIDSKRLPSTAEGLKALVEKPRLMLTPWDGPYIKGGIPEDPWGHPYRYVRRGGGRDEYDLFSCGPDGLPGTADDISYPK